MMKRWIRSKPMADCSLMATVTIQRLDKPDLQQRNYSKCWYHCSRETSKSCHSTTGYEHNWAAHVNRKLFPYTVITLVVYAEVGVTGTRARVGSRAICKDPFKTFAHCSIWTEQLPVEVFAFKSSNMDIEVVTRQDATWEPHTVAEQLHNVLKFDPLTTTVPPG